MGINDGDYIYVDANPADRPYLGASPSDPFFAGRRDHLFPPLLSNESGGLSVGAVNGGGDMR